MADTLFDLAPYRELFVWDDEHPNGHVGFVCGICGVAVDEQPCQHHAPIEIPGLTLVECEATPRHWLWVLDRDDYGTPCFWCERDRYAQQEWDRQACRHRAWRRWKLTHRLASWAYSMGITGGTSTKWGNGCDRCLTDTTWRGKRCYILGVDRYTWRCWRRRHRRGESVGFGYCGKCMPWPCCGSQREAHEPGCAEPGGSE